MRKVILSLVVGLAGLGAVAATPSNADAHAPRACYRARGCWHGPRYGGYRYHAGWRYHRPCR